MVLVVRHFPSSVGVVAVLLIFVLLCADHRYYVSQSFVLLMPPAPMPFSSRSIIVRRRTTCTHYFYQHCSSSTTRRWNNWLGDLWEEVIEFSTYGPSERKLIKARREQQQQQQRQQQSDRTPTNMEQGVMGAYSKNAASSSSISDDDERIISLQAFQAAAASIQRTKTSQFSKGEVSEKELQQPPLLDDFDGYALRDLLVSKWGVPLDVDFERRGYYSSATSTTTTTTTATPSVYVTVLPVAFGNRRLCRHETELDYLMHLQAVVEILHRYDNLEPWRFFLESTSKSPKPGVESVPFRLTLSPSDLANVLNNNKKS